ncbi:MAG: hypothetical protein KZQ83_17410 [gamma proteobacterium symbiont of Taylorina sp.]|nr:hypothetical protein [gamma proteobacterium symbiont of Taylorina sp.]
MPTRIDFSEVNLANPSDWLSMQALHDEYQHIPLKTIRYLIHNRERKGLSQISKKFGKQILTNKLGFGHWMANV